METAGDRLKIELNSHFCVYSMSPFNNYALINFSFLQLIIIIIMFTMDFQDKV